MSCITDKYPNKNTKLKIVMLRSTKYIRGYLLYYSQLTILRRLRKIQGSCITIDFNKLDTDRDRRFY